MNMIDQLIRISRKGAFISQVAVEKSETTKTADPLMSLLWNDYTGFFRSREMDELNKALRKKYKNCTFKLEQIMVGVSNLLTVLK